MHAGFCLFRAIGYLASIAGVVAAFGTAAQCEDQSAATPKDTIKDEIFARKILMDTIDDHMDEIDWMLTSGKPIDLPKTVEHADTISVMLLTFPHLFPPGTNQWQPGAKRDPARDTFAAPDLWVNYADFYRQAAAASRLAYTASRTKHEAEFRGTMAALRTACDSCHALYVKTDK